MIYFFFSCLIKLERELQAALLYHQCSWALFCDSSSSETSRRLGSWTETTGADEATVDGARWLLLLCAGFLCRGWNAQPACEMLCMDVTHCSVLGFPSNLFAVSPGCWNAAELQGCSADVRRACPRWFRWNLPDFEWVWGYCECMWIQAHGEMSVIAKPRRFCCLSGITTLVPIWGPDAAAQRSLFSWVMWGVPPGPAWPSEVNVRQRNINVFSSYRRFSEFEL